MAQPAVPGWMTFEEAARLDSKEHGGEIDAGRWVPVTRGTWNHGEIIAEVCFWLKQYARANPGWSVSAGDPGIKLTADPPTLRGPDAALVRADRRPVGKGAAGWLDGAPEVAFEVQGDSQSSSELARKALEYLDAGARMVVVLDPDRRSAMLYTPPDHITVLGPDDALDGGDVLPGFRVRVGDLFPARPAE
ncbi:MAG: Uma2 family endonuclease [Polyangiaceae bacterium]